MTFAAAMVDCATLPPATRRPGLTREREREREQKQAKRVEKVERGWEQREWAESERARECVCVRKREREGEGEGERGGGKG